MEKHQQPSLFDQPKPETAHHTTHTLETLETPEPSAGSINNRRKPEINLKAIEAQLKQDAGSLSIKVRRSNEDVRVHIRETDNGLDIRINPKRIRTPAQLDQVMTDCRSSIHWS